MATGNARTVDVNGISYRWPGKPVVVVCIDGGDPAYLRQFLADGAIPNIARFMRQGFATIADGTVPSFTCPNNMSIITGTPASKHGISGNYYLDTATGEAVVMTGPELLRGDTILARFAAAGAKVVSITAKDKLRKQLGKNLDLTRGNVSFSSERADKCTLAENGIENVLELVGMPLPDMYSMELSLFVLEAGVKLLERGHRDLMYLSLTDYVQHKYAPAESEARRFYQELDQRFGRLEALGAVVALTADHGMNDKSDAAGKPNVIWLQDILDATFGKGDTTVICPITDAFVAHHGALGGFVRVWCRGRTTPRAGHRVDQQSPFIHQHLFQSFGPLQALVEISCFGDTIDPVQDRPGVPGTKEYPDLALWRQGAPETPHHRPIEFFVGRLAHAMGLDMAWIHPFVEQVDGCPATCAVKAADQDNHRKPGRFRQFDLGIEQGLTQGRDFLFID